MLGHSAGSTDFRQLPGRVRPVLCPAAPIWTLQRWTMRPEADRRCARLPHDPGATQRRAVHVLVASDTNT